MAKIRITTMKDGAIVLDRSARRGVSLDDICEIAVNEVNGGYADYARVTVDGAVYIEFES